MFQQLTFYFFYRSGSDEDYSQKHQLLTDLVEQIDSLKAEKEEQAWIAAEKKKKVLANVVPSTSGTQKVKSFSTTHICLESMQKGNALFWMQLKNQLTPHSKLENKGQLIVEEIHS